MPFKFTVFEPPKFTNPVVKKIDLFASNKAYYSLPVAKEVVGEYVTHDNSLPRFIKFNYPLY